MPFYRLSVPVEASYYDYDFFSANMAFKSIPKSKQEMALIPIIKKIIRDNGYIPERITVEYRDLVCFTGSFSDNHINEMPLISTI